MSAPKFTPPTVAESHVRMMRDYLDSRVRQLEQELSRAEYRLEEARESQSMFEAKARMAEKVAV